MQRLNNWGFRFFPIIVDSSLGTIYLKTRCYESYKFSAVVALEELEFSRAIESHVFTYRLAFAKTFHIFLDYKRVLLNLQLTTCLSCNRDLRHEDVEKLLRSPTTPHHISFNDNRKIIGYNVK
jgi:hypothetical protein